MNKYGNLKTLVQDFLRPNRFVFSLSPTPFNMWLPTMPLTLYPCHINCTVSNICTDAFVNMFVLVFLICCYHKLLLHVIVVTVKELLGEYNFPLMNSARDSGVYVDPPPLPPLSILENVKSILKFHCIQVSLSLCSFLLFLWPASAVISSATVRFFTQLKEVHIKSQSGWFLYHVFWILIFFIKKCLWHHIDMSQPKFTEVSPVYDYSSCEIHSSNVSSASLLTT